MKLATAEININFQARLQINLSNKNYCIDVDDEVNNPMKLDVAVDILGSMFISSKMGPIKSPPATPRDPARMPATKTMPLNLR